MNIAFADDFDARMYRRPRKRPGTPSFGHMFDSVPAIEVTLIALHQPRPEHNKSLSQQRHLSLLTLPFVSWDEFKVQDRTLANDFAEVRTGIKCLAGTFRTCARSLTMSVTGGKTDIPHQRPEVSV